VNVDRVMDRIRPTRGEGEVVIPWAEGNGLWRSIEEAVVGLAGADAITFFVLNPYACDSAEGLSLRIGHPLSRLKPALDRLVERGLLNAVELGDVRVYELTRDPCRRQTLQQYVFWLREGYHWARMVMDQEGLRGVG